MRQPNECLTWSRQKDNFHLFWRQNIVLDVRIEQHFCNHFIKTLRLNQTKQLKNNLTQIIN